MTDQQLTLASTTATEAGKEAGKAKFRVRQDRHAVSKVRYLLELRGSLLEIIDYSAFGLAVHSAEAFPESLEVVDCKIIVDGITLATLDLKKVRSERLASGEFRVAFEITSGPLAVEKLTTLPEIYKILSTLSAEQQKVLHVPIPFVAKVYQLKDLLQRLEKSIQELCASKSFLSRTDLSDFEETVITFFGNSISQITKNQHDELAEILKNQPEGVVKSAFDFFREQMKGLLYQSPFAHRSLTKPRGYAGDFEMMNLIYRQHDMGATLFARCVERGLLLHPEPQAVRNRINYLREKIAASLTRKDGGVVKVLSVASGPAAEIQELIKVLPDSDLERIEVSLLDQDYGSLMHAQRMIRKISKESGKNIEVRLIHQSIKEVIMKGLIDGPFDLIYSAGLFDYFLDPLARKAGKALLNSVASGGKLVIGNFDAASPSRFGMSLFFDWNLIYRSRADLEKLFSYPGTRLAIEQEPNGINLFCVIEC